ncbi:hypothetical protein QAD02_008575 [Eretmocerus hayati]|uniref:Uncharacterized protein n=1 Tax=Eretmocerus hayati TaxID=131215 RepID=A0ACC2N7H4_9HYME|nr:hypothetical protein QAD02_008575 [Eretmocerus hayati]
MNLFLVDSEEVVDPAEEIEEIENDVVMHQSVASHAPMQDVSNVPGAQAKPAKEVPLKLTGLIKYMEKSADGKIILNYYNTHGLLNPNHRRKLIKLVIKREKDRAFKDIKPNEFLKKWPVTPNRLEILAQEIEYEFDGENALAHFRRSRKHAGVYSKPSGALYNHLGYTKGVLRKLGHLKGEKDSEVVAELQEYAPSEEVLRKDKYLQTHVEPAKKVKRYWKATKILRKTLLMVDKIEIQKYLQRYPPLKTQLAIKLFPIDFYELHPTKANSMIENWGSVKSCIQEELLVQQLKNADDSVLQKLISTNKLNEEELNCTLLSLLPALIPARRPGRKRKSDGKETTQKKATLAERRNSFIHVVPVDTDFESTIDDLKEQLVSCGISFQPTVICVGEVINPKSFRVILDDVVYSFETCLSAIDFTFKVFFALDCKYPPLSETIWLFIQQAIYGIEVPGDELTSSIDILLGRVKSIVAVPQDLSNVENNDGENVEL